VTVSPGRGPQPFLRILLAGAALALTASAITTLPGVRNPATIAVGVGLNAVVYGISVLLCAARVLSLPVDRAAWACLTAAALAQSVGGLFWAQQLRYSGPSTDPYATWSSLPWLLFYPFVYAGLVLLLRARARSFFGSVWLDGLVGAFGLAALAAYTLNEVGWLVGDKTVLAVKLAYPTADLLMLALVTGILTLFGSPPQRMWRLILLALVLFTAADFCYLLLFVNKAYVEGLAVELLWPAAMLLLGLAAWQPVEPPPDLRLRGWSVLVLPFGFALAAVTLLLYAATSDLPLLVALLSTGTVVAAIVRTALTFRDLRAVTTAQQDANTDELTGLANRRGFLAELGALLADRDPARRLAVLVVDLDGFKEVNDSFGHRTGDDLLRMVGPRLVAALRRDDVLARLGGDEFGIVLLGADAAYAERVASRLLSTLRRPFVLDLSPVHLDASVGIALFPDHGDGVDPLLQHADTAMYAAKRGRWGHAMFRAERDSVSRHRLETMEALRVALGADDQLVLAYQPKTDLQTRQVVGVEALVRWRHPTRGLLLPDAFLPLAERGGLMAALTDRLLDAALAQCRRWQDQGLLLSVAVNLSVSTLHDPALPHRVQRLLERHGLPADRLILEITEDVFMADRDGAQQVVATLRDSGVGIAVDDYGTGYSSLSYLRALPVDELKLDRSFVGNLSRDPRAAAIVRSSIELAHSLGMCIVAEGVEDGRSVQLLRDWHCDFAQGYHLGPPQSAESLGHRLLAAETPEPVPAPLTPRR
jgi:diguanylate cyclase (GGDEF)-like protein